MAIPDQDQSEAAKLASQLHGKTLHIPDLLETFSHWDSGSSPFLPKLSLQVDSVLQRLTSDDRKLKALRAADFTSVLARWYPDASWEELRVATSYTVWIFVWDDEIDVGDTETAHDEELAQKYYQESLDYIHNVLGLDSGADGSLTPPRSPPKDSNLAVFGDVGALVPVTDRVQRQRFYDELRNFMIQVGVEHGYRMRGEIPSAEKYLEMRRGSVGCGPQIAITDYMLKVRIPETIMTSKAMRALWDETIMICIILNDVYSVQKEIAQGSLLNLVSVLYYNLPLENKTLHAVTRQFMALLGQAMDGFEAAAGELEHMTKDNPEQHENVAAYVRWCCFFITGVLTWSLESRRYGMQKCVRIDGGLDVVL